MQASLLIAKFKTKASGAMVLRAVIVGASFAVMIGLAAVLGIAPFGALIYSWSIALLCATVLSAGGPMILLRALTDGHGISQGMVAVYALGLPVVLAVLVWPFLSFILPAIVWLPALCAAVAINFSACVASVLRARGSLMVSMALRDAGPFVALGLGAILTAGRTPEAALLGAAAVLVTASIIAVVWARGLVVAPSAASSISGRKGQLSLWGTSVLGMAIAQMDLILGGVFLSAEALGLYALLRRIANVVALPVSVATWVSAPAVSAAFGARDWSALRAASLQASRTAWFPALVLFAFGMSGAVLAGILGLLSPVMVWVGVALLSGALLQAYWASGYTVGTLTDAPALSLVARLIVLFGYLALAMWQGPALTPMGNALAYVIAMSGGSFWLCCALRRRFGVDTSAAALWVERGVFWKTS